MVVLILQLKVILEIFFFTIPLLIKFVTTF